jgi:hypothetical protein
MPDQDFHDAVAAAKADASAACHELSISYAVDFKSDPMNFDPRKLIALGKEGMLSFLNNVSVPARQPDPPVGPTVIDHEVTSGADRNWIGKQVVPLPFEFSAVVIGLIAGLSIIVGSAIAITH